jgi:c(7)-type cytochrome triheme protein
MQRAGRVLAAIAAVVLLAAATAPAVKREWLPIAKDGIHDPEVPGLRILQEPSEALSALPPDTTGNLVRWVEAIEGGYIDPRSSVNPDTKIETRATQVLLRRTGEMPMVVFPHRQHTAWLDCSNCHDQLFAREAGRTDLNMLMVLQGDKCGQCHGAVAFPLTECNRCHSLPRGSDGERLFRNLVRP